jgi:hypothetical protein
MDQVFWKLKGYGSRNIIYQDNKSAILLEKRMVRRNGKRTSTLTCVISSFTDIPRRYVRQWCPTEDMTVIFTKKPSRRSVLEVQRFDYGSHGTATSQAK